MTKKQTKPQEIRWEKLIWPYNSKDIEDEEPELSFDDDMKYKDLQEIPTPENTKAARFVFTQMGIIPVDEIMAPNKVFNFWTGHTNFPITEGVQNTIEEVEGVETLDVFTRYRFRIAVGKSFSDREVRHNIQQALYGEKTTRHT